MAQNLSRRKVKKVAKPPKKLEEYVQTKPEQLTLFQLLAPGEKAYSNTVELYDFIPKYHWGKVTRVNGKYLDPLFREFECRGGRYKVRLAPASLDGVDGVTRDYFPGKREELVEDALRKLATEGKGVFLDDEAGVTFTLYQLQEELKRNGHTYSYDELKDALYVCASANIRVTTENGRAILVSNIFETLGLHSPDGEENKEKRTKVFVRFNSLVTTCIRARTFRPFNYEKSMSFKSVVARQLHKRLAHHYIQASITQPYSILLTTMIRDFGLTEYAWLSHNLGKAIKGFEELEAKEVILSYQVEKTLDTDARHKLLEAKFILTPHPYFVSEIMHANARQKSLT